MSKLTKYTTFDALKTQDSLSKTNTVASKKLMSEFEDFLNLVKSEFSLKQKDKAVYDKKPD